MLLIFAFLSCIIGIKTTYIIDSDNNTTHFCFRRRFTLTVTAFTVLFTAWYRPNYIFTCYLSLAVKTINLYTNYYALPCCKQNYYYYYLLL